MASDGRSIEGVLSAIEQHLRSARKSVIRGLLSAVASALLAWLLLFRAAPRVVKVPFLEFEIPSAIAAFVFLVASIVLGVVANSTFRRAMNLEAPILAKLEDRQSQEFAAYIARLPPMFLRWMPLAVAASAGLLHILTFFPFLMALGLFVRAQPNVPFLVSLFYSWWGVLFQAGCLTTLSSLPYILIIVRIADRDRRVTYWNYWGSVRPAI